jgi:hypothetical protein
MRCRRWGLGSRACLVPVLIVATAITAACGAAPTDAPRTTVSIEGRNWLIDGRIVHEGSPAEGLLLNVRMVNTVLEDLGPHAAEHLPDFDPDTNTDRFIARIPHYHALGVRAFTISLQGGHTGYEQVLNSAFDADGALRPAYMNRVARVIDASNRHGVVVILSAFYQRQHWHDRALAGRPAMLDAVANVARWIADRGDRNVLLEISNEYSHGGFRNWRDDEWMRSPDGQVELIRQAKAAAPGLLVSTSDGGHGRIHDAIAEAADFILLHFNNTALEDYAERIRAARAHGKPVVCNEDDKIGYAGAEALRLSVQHGAGWGMMHSRLNQYAPFEYAGLDDDPVTYGMMRRLATPGETMAALTSDELFVIVTQPNDGAVLRAGADLAVRASIAGGDASGIGEVQFFANGRLLGASASAPWVVRWEGVPTGAYNLTAVVIGTTGDVLARSRPVDIQVTAAPPGR